MTFISRIRDSARKLADKTVEAGEAVRKHVDENKDRWKGQAAEALDTAKATAREAVHSGAESTRNIYRNVRYSKSSLRTIQNDIQAQGGYYRELLRNNRASDSIFIGGESLIALLAAGEIPPEIEAAYRAAYPDMAEGTSFVEKVRDLEGSELQGLVSGVKGKLFEQKYVEYLNDGNLPDGYSAAIAGSTTQSGWDIQIEGPNNEIASVLQAKATDSVSYVSSALERYPGMDVVTTDEVYSHLVMNGISEGITSSAIANVDLTDQLEKATDAAELSMDFAPPIFTLAFIAFTSYKEESLTLYEKARSAGNRSGKAYLSYLVGGGIAAITNTWWLGVVGSVGSRYLGDEGLRKAELFERLKKVYKVNQEIIDRIKREASAQHSVAGVTATPGG